MYLRNKNIIYLSSANVCNCTVDLCVFCSILVRTEQIFQLQVLFLQLCFTISSDLVITFSKIALSISNYNPCLVGALVSRVIPYYTWHVFRYCCRSCILKVVAVDEEFTLLRKLCPVCGKVNCKQHRWVNLFIVCCRLQRLKWKQRGRLCGVHTAWKY